MTVLSLFIVFFWHPSSLRSVTPRPASPVEVTELDDYGMTLTVVEAVGTRSSIAYTQPWQAGLSATALRRLVCLPVSASFTSQ